MSIKKAIFAVGGFGTRFLPATKAQPKEMLPVVDKPIIQYLVEEAVEAGIQEIIFVTGRGKTSIENHFDKSYELEETLDDKGKKDLLHEVKKISHLAKFAYVRQPEQRGDGHALLCAKPFIDHSEPVLMVFPDYIMPRSNKTLIKLIDTYREYHDPVIATDKIKPEDASKFGCIQVENVFEDICEIKHFVEKPKDDKIIESLKVEDEILINNGYAVITPSLWKYIENASSTAADGEIRVADAYTNFVDDGNTLRAVVPDQPGYDCGDKFGFVKATIDMALQRDDLRDKVIDFLTMRMSHLEKTNSTPIIEKRKHTIKKAASSIQSINTKSKK